MDQTLAPLAGRNEASLDHAGLDGARLDGARLDGARLDGAGSADQAPARPSTEPHSGKIAAAGAATGLAALFSAAACCVLPLAFAWLGIGAGGLALFVPLRLPLVVAAAVIVAVGWLLYWRRGRIGTASACPAHSPGAGAPVLLSTASVAVLLAVGWDSIEPPLMRLLTGA